LSLLFVHHPHCSFVVHPVRLSSLPFVVVFESPVHRTEKRPWTQPNWTDGNRTFSCGCLMSRHHTVAGLPQSNILIDRSKTDRNRSFDAKVSDQSITCIPSLIDNNNNINNNNYLSPSPPPPLLDTRPHRRPPHPFNHPKRQHPERQHSK
jgi:hypothetical protein